MHRSRRRDEAGTARTASLERSKNMIVRRALPQDLHKIQEANLQCLPENYHMKYYLMHYLTWPQLLWVAVEDDEVVGYVMGKLEAEDKTGENHGHITSIAVLRTHRGMGIATLLMRSVHADMLGVWGLPYCTLHVRCGNRAARHLYEHTLGYTPLLLDAGYYQDGEDAWKMRCDLR